MATETVPVDSFSEEEADENIWGRLFPVGASFTSVGNPYCTLFPYILWSF